MRISDWSSDVCSSDLKRHGATGVENYRDELGMLPEALSNYLLRLGWGHGDEEIISREDAVKWFDLDHVGRSPSRFDLKKLENLNGHYIREASNDRLAELVAPRLDREITDEKRALLARAMDGLKQRAKRSDARRVGKEWVSPCRCRWTPYQ